MNLASLNPGSRIVLSYPGKPDRLFERILGWPVGDGTCYIHVPAVSDQSHVSSDVFSDCNANTTAVSSQKPSVSGKDAWVSGSMSHGSSAPVTFRRPPPGLVGSQCLNESQMQRSSADTDAEACHARTPTKIFAACPEDSISGSCPDAKRLLKVSLCQRSVVPDAKTAMRSVKCDALDRGEWKRGRASVCTNLK